MISPVKVWRNQKKIADTVGKTGRIITYTIIRVPMSGFSNQAPYATAVVELSSKVRLITQVVDCHISQIKIGQKVRLVLRKIHEPDPDGVIPYGLKAVFLERG